MKTYSTRKRGVYRSFGNLNEQKYLGEDGDPEFPLKDHHTVDLNAGVSAYFRDIDRHLIRHIGEADAVVGCVAWLTEPSILEALADRWFVSLVVQKEDFLRPDWGTSKSELRRAYDAIRSKSLKADWDRWQFSLLRGANVCGPLDLEGVRCVGVAGQGQRVNTPRAHHKFVVFCRKSASQEWETEPGRWEYALEPYAVWTGSFNFTKNGLASLENAVVVESHDISQAYFNEWQQVAMLSESLDWEHEWVAPEFRIGT